MISDEAVVAIDFETANGDPASACAVGLAVVEEGAVRWSGATLLNPGSVQFDPRNIGVHRIRPRDVVSAPTFAQMWPGLSELLDRRTVIAHNASFDLKVLGGCLDAADLSAPMFETICTLALARRTWPERRTNTLKELSRDLDIPLTHHDPASDAVACSMVALHCCESVGAPDIRQAARMLGAGVSLYLGTSPLCAAPQHTRKASERASVNPEGPLAGTRWVFTGELSSMSRHDAEDLVAGLGGRCTGSVSGKTDYLVVGLAPGSKVDKALERREVGQPISIIRERRFLAMTGKSDEPILREQAGDAPPAPAGWYPDPLLRHEQRYWDGSAWTEHVFSSGVQGVEPVA